jgi:signal transduction histidine kinase
VVTPASRPSSIIHIGGEATIGPKLESALQDAFPGIKSVSCSGLEEAARIADSSEAGALLVMTNPESSSLARAREALDENGFPRWAVVASGRVSGSDPASDGEVVPSENLDPTVLAIVLRSVWDRHRLQRENARLRGTLMTFGSRIAHDLRTPIGGILTTAEMLREVLTEDAPQNVPLTQPLLDSTEGLVNLIERVSFFARANGSRDQAAPFDMGVPFWNAYQRLERSILSAKLEVKHPVTWPKVKGHENWLEVVWRILLGNAVQHSPSGTTVEAGWTDVEGGHRFWLRSAGLVPLEKQATLFFPFHRMSEPGAPRGLGLPVLRGLVELDGGSAGFRVPAIGGTEIYFLLPASGQI